MRELSSLIDLQVISTTEGRRLGTVADALVDLAAGELVCVTLARTPELQVVLAEDIEVIGPDALMVAGRDRLRSREDLDDELERGRSVLASPPSVVTSRGAQLGRLASVHIDEGSFRVVRFEITGGPLRDVTEGVLALPVLEGTVHGEDTVIVPHEVVARRLTQAGGLRGSFRSLAHKLRGGYEDLSEKLGESGDKLRESGKKIKTQTGQARQRADELTKAAREKADKLATDAREAVSEAREGAKEAAESAEKEVEAAEDASEAVEETAEAVEEEAEAVAEEVAEVVEETEERPATDEGEAEEDATEGAEEEKHLVPEAATPLPEGAQEEGDAVTDSDKGEKNEDE